MCGKLCLEGFAEGKRRQWRREKKITFTSPYSFSSLSPNPVITPVSKNSHRLIQA